MAEVIIRTRIPQYILTILGILLVAEYFLAVGPLTAFREEILRWGTIIYNGSILLGTVMMLRYHGGNIIRPGRETRQRYYSLVAIITFFVFLAVGWGIGLSSKAYVSLYRMTLIPAGATLWGLNLIFSAMGVYRAMRITSLEALALLVGGMAYFLKEMPIVGSIFPSILDIGDWFLVYAMSSAARVAVLTAACITILVSIRMIIGKEKTALV